MTEPGSADEQSGRGPTEWFTHPVGVGPWAEEYPDLPVPEDEHFDPELLENGDRRNVVDGYRYWRLEAIVADIDSRRHGLHIAIENFENDSNIGTRSAPPTPSRWTPSTSSDANAGTGGARWSPTATSI